jgi:hypothetical protein
LGLSVTSNKVFICTDHTCSDSEPEGKLRWKVKGRFRWQRRDAQV